MAASLAAEFVVGGELAKPAPPPDTPSTATPPATPSAGGGGGAAGAARGESVALSGFLELVVEVAQKEAAARSAASMPDLLAARLQRYAAQQRTRLMAARAAHRAVLEDGGVQQLLLEQQITMQRAFVQCCRRLPADSYARFVGGGLEKEAAESQLRASHFVRQAMGGEGAGGGSRLARLCGPPVVIHLCVPPPRLPPPPNTATHLNRRRGPLPPAPVSPPLLCLGVRSPESAPRVAWQADAGGAAPGGPRRGHVVPRAEDRAAPAHLVPLEA